MVSTLLEAANVRIERIVSNGHSSAPGFWYDQDQHEWVMVLKGRARLRFEGEEQPVEMRPGDFVNIPATSAIGSSGRRRTGRRSGWRCITAIRSERCSRSVTDLDRLCRFRLRLPSLKFLDQRLLPGLDLPSRRSHVEEGRPVDLRELHPSPRLRGPFHRERVADGRTWVAVALERPGVDDLAALLLHRRQSDEWACRRDAGFFLEFPPGGFEQVLARLDLALGNRPGAVVLVLEKRAAGMGKEHLQLAIVNAIHQQSGADTGHKRQPDLRRRENTAPTT